jgi:pimeloyl-ACP methyl ester carboxylesterase
MSLYTQSQGPVDAPTIVFLHGMGVSSWMWTQQVEALSGRYHTLTIDLPGNGESQASEWRSLADSAAQVAAVIQGQAHGGKAHVVGLSLGGYVALALLGNHPATVESMIVSGVITRPMPNAGLLRLIGRWQMKLAYIPGFGWLTGKSMGMPDDSIPLMIRDLRRLRPGTVERVYGEILNFSLPHWVQPPLTRRLLAVAGGAEVKAILESLPGFLSLTPAERVATRLAPGLHHGWPGERPDLFNATIAAWVENQPLPSELQPSRPATVGASD